MIRVPDQYKPLLSSLVETFAKPSTAQQVSLFCLAPILTGASLAAGRWVHDVGQ